MIVCLLLGGFFVPYSFSLSMATVVAGDTANAIVQELREAFDDQRDVTRCLPKTMTTWFTSFANEDVKWGDD